VSPLVHLALNDLRLTTRERASFVWMLILPIAMMWLFGNTGGGGSGPPKVTLTVVDRDGGWLARAFVRELEGPNVDLTEVVSADLEKTGKKVRMLVLPEGFTAKVLAGEQQKLRLEKDKDADNDFSRAAEAHILRASARTLGRLVEMNASGTLGAGGTRAQEEFAELAKRPALVRLDVVTAGRGRPVPSGTAQSVPGILTMTVLMMTVIYGGVFLTIERKEGMLRRQLSLPISRRELLLGKLGGRVIMAGTQIVLLVIAGRFLFHVDFGASPVGLGLLLTSYAVCCAGLGTLCGAVFLTPEQASAIGWLTTMVMAAMGGCWWPSEVMPRWLWNASHVFPTAWAMDAFHALISFGRGLEAVWLPSAVLIAFGALFSAVASRYLKPSV